MYGATESQVSRKADSKIFQCTLSFYDRVQIKQRLSRMLVCTITGIYHRNVHHFCCIAAGAFDGTAHDDDVGILGDSEQSVGKGLALLRRGIFGSAHYHGVAIHPLHGSIKGKHRTGGRFKEEQRGQFTLHIRHDVAFFYFSGNVH